MKIEILYPQLCCLYGDKGNTLFLQKCLPQAEFVFTQLNDKPRFLTEDVDLCCMYSMSEQSQELVLSRMGQWKEEIFLDSTFKGRTAAKWKPWDCFPPTPSARLPSALTPFCKPNSRT